MRPEGRSPDFFVTKGENADIRMITHFKIRIKHKNYKRKFTFSTPQRYFLIFVPPFWAKRPYIVESQSYVIVK